MMREILFRGKRVDNGKWVEGYYCKEFGHHQIIDDHGMSYTLNIVDPDTIGQYTDVDDVKDVKIFEGDKILCVQENHKGHVIFMDGMFATDAAGWGYMPLCGEYDYKVIGNIHDKEHLK